MKIAITGGPRTGKTTLSGEGEGVRHTDDLIDLGWSEASEAASKWFDDPEVDTIEGVAVNRALRKWLERNETGKPCDKVIYLHIPRVKLKRGQESMLKGCLTVWQGIKGDLEKRGVAIEEVII